VQRGHQVGQAGTALIRRAPWRPAVRLQREGDMQASKRSRETAEGVGETRWPNAAYLGAMADWR